MKTTGDSTEQLMTPQMVKAFNEYTSSGSMPRAAQVAGVARSTLWKWSRTKEWRQALRRHIAAQRVSRVGTNDKAYKRALAHLLATVDGPDQDRALKAAVALFQRLSGSAREQDLEARLKRLVGRIRELEGRLGAEPTAPVQAAGPRVARERVPAAFMGRVGGDGRSAH